MYLVNLKLYVEFVGGPANPGYAVPDWPGVGVVLAYI